MQTIILHLWSSRSECCELLLHPDGLHPGNAPAVHCTVGVSSLYISYSFLHQARGELESSWGVFKHEGWRRVWGAESGPRPYLNRKCEAWVSTVTPLNHNQHSAARQHIFNIRCGLTLVFRLAFNIGFGQRTYVNIGDKVESWKWMKKHYPKIYYFCTRNIKTALAC